MRQAFISVCAATLAMVSIAGGASARAADDSNWVSRMVGDALKRCQSASMDAEVSIDAAQKAGWPTFVPGKAMGNPVMFSVQHRDPADEKSPSVSLGFGGTSGPMGKAKARVWTCLVQAEAGEAAMIAWKRSAYPGNDDRAWMGKRVGDEVRAATLNDMLDPIEDQIPKLQPNEHLVLVNLDHSGAVSIATTTIFEKID